MDALRLATAALIFAGALTLNQEIAAADPPEGDDPAPRLSKVDFYAFGGVGFAGTISVGETLYKKILAGEAPEAVFLKVYSIGSPAAKAYALCGLQSLDSARYGALREEFLTGEFQVPTMAGCIMSKVSPAQAVALIEKRKPAK